MVCLVFNFAPVTKVALKEHKSYTAAELNVKVQDHLHQIFDCKNVDFYLLHNGKLIDNTIINGEVHVIPRLRGGKGGFGSMLRAIGAQIEKTTNREACRDLSGRRLRDINEEKRLKKWITEQAEREQEALLRKKKKLEKLNEVVKHEFKDEDYTKARLEMSDNIHEAVEQGLQAATEESKVSEEAKEVKINKRPKNKVKGNLWVDDLLDESDISASEEEEDEGKSPKKKIKLS